MNTLRRLLRLKSKEEVLEEVEREPIVVEAREQLKRSDRILWEMKQLDRRKTPRTGASAWNH